MYGTLGAGRFVFPEGASRQARSSIIQKLPALGAQLFVAVMLVTTREGYHGLNGVAFSLHPGIIVRHVRFLLSVHFQPERKGVRSILLTNSYP